MKIAMPHDIQIADYDYPLPDEQIAKYPLGERDRSKLLVYRNGEITDTQFTSLTDYLPKDSLLVFNNTKVIQARMYFQKETGATIEVFCLEPHSPNDYILNFQATKTCSWLCLVGNLKKWKEGKLSKTIHIGDKTIIVTARKDETIGDSHIITFEWSDADFAFSDLLEAGGELPIPPYLNRKTEDKDKHTYQTVYSKIKGSVAAPTAGLHFTPTIFDLLKKNGFETDELTLHVGAGTFKPVKTELIQQHAMHTEFISVQRTTIEHILNQKLKGNKVIAVGTTSVRTIESLYYLGSLLHHDKDAELKVGQWQPYEAHNKLISVTEALTTLLSYLDTHCTDTLLADTQIMIAPGYSFNIVDGIVTNFHQPRSTLLLLVSAFVKGNWNSIYTHALEHDYRFLSYGDSSLLL